MKKERKKESAEIDVKDVEQQRTKRNSYNILE